MRPAYHAREGVPPLPENVSVKPRAQPTPVVGLSIVWTESSGMRVPVARPRGLCKLLIVGEPETGCGLIFQREEDVDPYLEDFSTSWLLNLAHHAIIGVA